MDQIVSDFIVRTTLVDVQPNVNEFTCLSWIFLDPSSDVWRDSAGSIRELYIEPLLPCVGDFDNVIFSTKQVAVQHHPRQIFSYMKLPPKYKDNVEVFKLVDGQYPGYVILKKFGELQQQLDNSFRFVVSTLESDNGVLICDKSERSNVRLDLHGPAFRRAGIDSMSLIEGHFIEREYVDAVRCLSWPQQAVDWSTRRRNFNWPDSKTVEYIVRRNCDFVQISHHQCRHDGLLSIAQWRMSFSRAEVVLLNTWTPIQQIVYHMLRTVLKGKGLSEVRDSGGCRILSRYHVKASMLWFCELTDPIWWTSYNVVVLSSKCLHVLLNCCYAGNCHGYFVAYQNLFECDVNSAQLREICEGILLLINVDYLTRWFISCYIRKCVPESVQSLFDDVNSEDKLRSLTSSMTSPVVESSRIFKRYVLAQRDIVLRVSKDAPNRKFRLDAVRYMDEYLFRYFQSAVSLHLSARLDRINFNDVINAMSKVSLTDVCRARPATFGSLVNSATSLMQQSTTHYDSAANNCLRLYLSYSYLSEALKVSEQVSEKCVVRVSLSVLYYITGQYKASVEQCTLASRLKCNSLVVEGQMLPKFDDNIDNVLGLVVLYKRVQLVARSRKRQVFINIYNVFTVEFFLHFLQFKCSLHDNTQSTTPRYNEDQWQLKLINNANDFLLYYLTLYSMSYESRKFTCNKLSPVLSTDFSVSNLRELLVLYGVEKLTQYHQFLASKFSSFCTVVTTDIQAMYDYKSGFYESCLQLSQQNVMVQGIIHLVLVSHCMSPLVDDELASLVGLINVYQRTSFAFAVNQSSLSLYLLVQCKLKLKYTANSLIDELLTVIAARLEFNYITNSPDYDELRSKIAAHIKTPVINETDELMLAFAYSRLMLEFRAQCTI